MINLTDRLNGLEPADRAAYLRNIWQTFAQTEYYQALELLLVELVQDAEQRLFLPTAPPTLRSFAAGEVSGLRRFLVSIGASIKFNPAIYDLPEPAADEDTDEIPADSDSFTY